MISMEPLALTQMLINLVLEKAGGTLKACCQKMFILQSWQQAPVASTLIEYKKLVAAIVEVFLGGSMQRYRDLEP